MLCKIENEKLCREKINKLNSLLTGVEDLQTKIREIAADKNFSDDPNRESRAWAVLNKEELEIILQRRIDILKKELETVSFDFLEMLGMEEKIKISKTQDQQDQLVWFYGKRQGQNEEINEQSE